MMLSQNEKWATGIINKFDKSYRHRWEVYQDLLLTNLEDRTIWVDLGCGKNAEVAENSKKTAYAVGVDRERNPKLIAHPYVIADINYLPFKGNSIDFVSLRFVVEHIPEPAAFFTEVKRILKEQGKILIITTNIWSPFIFLPKLLPTPLRTKLMQLIFKVEEKDIFITYHRFNSLSKINQSDFDIESIIFIQDCNYTRRSLFLIYFGWHLFTKLPIFKYLRTNMIILYKKTS